MMTVMLGLALVSLGAQEVEIEKAKERAKADAKAAVMMNRPSMARSTM